MVGSSSWQTVRQIPSVCGFAAALSLVHPELARAPLSLEEAVRIAHREAVSVSLCDLPRPARLVRYGDAVGIQVSTAVPPDLWATRIMHELCHFWRDDPGRACYHRANYGEKVTDDELFAEVFALHVTATSAQRAAAMRTVRPDSPLLRGARLVRGVDLGIF